MEEPCSKKRRGPYKRYIIDHSCPVPRTTRWRNSKNQLTTPRIDTLENCGPREESDSDGIGGTGGFGDNYYDNSCDSDILGSDSDISDSDSDNSGSDSDISDSDSDNSGSDSDNSGSDSDNSGSDSDNSGSDSDNSGSDSDNSGSDSDNSGSDSDGSCVSDNSDQNDPTNSQTTASSDTMSEKIYPGAQVTVLGAYCAIMEFKRVCRVSFSTIVVLLNLLQILCPPANLLPTTKYQLCKFAKRYMCPHSRTNYCRTCKSQILVSQKCSNRSCVKKEPNTLIEIVPDQTLQRTISDNWEKIKPHRLTRKGIVGTFFNTDGVSPFKSSQITIWPIYLALVNLPPSLTMLKRNIVTCAFWVGNCKPPMSTFLGHLKQIF